MSFGVTVSLTEKSSGQLRQYLSRMKELRAELVFTTLRIPGDDLEGFKENFRETGAYIRENFTEFVADVSPSVFRNFSLEELKQCGVTALRIDNGIPAPEIARLSQEFKIILNASTIDDAFIGELHRSGYRGEIEAWHNYYPRRNTGLDERFFESRNEWMHERKIRMAAFIPGDAELRGTIFEGLPTLERHRGCPPFLAYLEMIRRYHADTVILGDFDLQEETFQKMKALLGQGGLRIRVEHVTEPSILGMTHHNRVDVAADVIRSNEYRRINQKHFSAAGTAERPAGSVTIDNEGYSRYMGEMQIVLKDLPADERVNVVANVVGEDLPLLPYLKDSTQPFVLVEAE